MRARSNCQGFQGGEIAFPEEQRVAPVPAPLCWQWHWGQYAQHLQTTCSLGPTSPSDPCEGNDKANVPLW